MAALGMATLMARDASAYCRTATCPPERKQGGGCDCEARVCNTPLDMGEEACGVTPIHWTSDCIGFAVAEQGSRELDGEAALAVLMQAFAAWEASDCGGGQTPGIHVESLGTVACGRVEYSPVQDGRGNVNLLLFRDDDWPYSDADSTLAKTTTSFDTVTGEIFDADIEVNTYARDFSLGDPVGLEEDLLSTLMHEAGHALGMAHCADCPAGNDPSVQPTMHMARFGLEMRTLEPDDVAGVCAAYPPSDFDRATCNPIPRHGFASECAEEQYVSGCQLAAPARLGRRGWLFAWLPLCWLLARRSARITA